MDRDLGAFLGDQGPDLVQIEGADPAEKIGGPIGQVLARLEIKDDAFPEDQQSGSGSQSEHFSDIRFPHRVDMRESHLRKALGKGVVASGQRRAREVDDEDRARFDCRMKISMGELKHGSKRRLRRPGCQAVMTVASIRQTGFYAGLGNGQ